MAEAPPASDLDRVDRLRHSGVVHALTVTVIVPVLPSSGSPPPFACSFRLRQGFSDRVRVKGRSAENEQPLPSKIVISPSPVTLSLFPVRLKVVTAVGAGLKLK